MDLESLYYFMEAAKDMHITETADRLFMSQQTLSNHIQRVEDYYGVRLFNRRPRLVLTQNGKAVLEFAEEVFAREKNLKNLLTDALQNDSGEIFIGASSPRSSFYLPDILEKFTSKYPHVKINLTDKSSSYLEHLVQKNELDFAVCVNSDIKKLNLNIRSIHSDPVYLCVSDRLLYQYYEKAEADAIKQKSLSGANLQDFSKLPFLKTTVTNRLGQLIEGCFQKTGIQPKIFLETGYTTMLVPLCNAGLAAGFSSRMNLVRWRDQLAADVNILPLYDGGKPVCASIYLVCHKQRYLNHHVLYFLSLLEEHFNQLEHFSIARLSGV